MGYLFLKIQITLQINNDEIAMIEKSPTGMRISSWLFHMTIKKQINHI
jgi:hypothetical protein